MTVAALEAVLRLYATGRRYEVPLWDLLSVRQTALLARARALAAVFKGSRFRASEAVAGGGSLPGHAIPSAELVLPVPSPTRVAARLRIGQPAVFCRLVDGALVFDLRAVPAHRDDDLIRAIRYALQQD
jgi:L-seryl-tRNA(Ser) seleniumtransferase